MKLAEIYEIVNEPRKALDLVYEGVYLAQDFTLIVIKFCLVIDSRKRRVKIPSGAQPDEGEHLSTSLFAEDKTVLKSKSSSSSMRQNRLTHVQLRELEAQKEKDVVQGYRRLKDLWSGMLAGEEGSKREWMLEAEKLVDMFRETRNLFLTSRVCSQLII